ncbi:sarcalumenin, partial [Asbolus verrucosus]
SKLIVVLTLVHIPFFQGVQGEAESEGPSESECRPYIEKALKELETGETGGTGTTETGDSKEDIPTVEITTDDSDHQEGEGEDEIHEEGNESTESVESDQNVPDEEHSEPEDTPEESSAEANETETEGEDTDITKEETESSQEVEAATSVESDDQKTEEASEETESEDKADTGTESQEQSAEVDTDTKSAEEVEQSHESVEEKESKEESKENTEETAETEDPNEETAEDTEEETQESSIEEPEQEGSHEIQEESKETDEIKGESAEGEQSESTEDERGESTEGEQGESTESEKGAITEDEGQLDQEQEDEGKESDDDETKEDDKSEAEDHDKSETKEDESKQDTSDEHEGGGPKTETAGETDEKSAEQDDSTPDASEQEDSKEGKDLSNRHFGDSEIFSKPLILFMGPWSGGKSSIINYLLDNEYNETSLRTGAEPSPAYFNILMYGEESEILDGTQLAADFTFSGLQKFGQGLEERLRGVKLPSKLLEKVNIVEIPGILEVRKQVSRVFPFNDACQWFIDRADIIFLVYDPSKLDVGPETEAILDQLKGREHQTRIILNKADQVKPEELMRVQGALIWNISPLMSSAQPPIMYTTSLWSRPYESWAPVRLLQAQERAFLRDLRSAVDKRIENKIASARRFAVRVRNHAKMVDCYLTTYYNHKSVFGNRKQVADEIIEHPQDYHIYEGLSTLTNISRYDLPDPDVYKDFFKLNPLYDFQQLSATCTYFRGCPINRLDVAIAYDLPELVGKHKRLVESALAEANQASVPGS